MTNIYCTCLKRRPVPSAWSQSTLMGFSPRPQGWKHHGKGGCWPDQRHWWRKVTLWAITDVSSTHMHKNTATNSNLPSFILFSQRKTRQLNIQRWTPPCRSYLGVFFVSMGLGRATQRNWSYPKGFILQRHPEQMNTSVALTVSDLISYSSPASLSLPLLSNVTLLLNAYRFSSLVLMSSLY